jgi:predicted  nucleic acid-binding Zn-ribbon protein
MRNAFIIFVALVAIVVVSIISNKSNQEQRDFYQAKYSTSVDKINALQQDVYNLTADKTSLTNQLELVKTNVVNLTNQVELNVNVIAKQDSTLSANSLAIENFKVTTKLFLKAAYGNNNQ